MAGNKIMMNGVDYTDTGLVNISDKITISEEYADSVTGINAYVRNGWVYIQAQVKATTETIDYATIDSEYRPKVVAYGSYEGAAGSTADANLCRFCRVNTNGTIRIVGNSDFRYAEYFTFIYPMQ